MDKYSYCDEIKEKFNVDELNSATLKYRIDGFIKACNMNLDDCLFTKEISITRTPYINTKSEGEYNINFSYHVDSVKGKNFVLTGCYDDINFAFTNYYNKDKNKNKINEIPFLMAVSKSADDYNYSIKMETAIDLMVRFTLNKYDEEHSEKIVFYANVDDFSSVLKLVRTFVNNPENVFNIYRDIMNKKEVVFNGVELGKAIEDDEELDMPMSKTQKKIKSILNNH